MKKVGKVINPQGIVAHWAKVWDDSEVNYKIRLVLGDGRVTENVTSIAEGDEKNFLYAGKFYLHNWDNCNYIKEVKKVPYGEGEMPDLFGKTLINKEYGNKFMVIGYSTKGRRQLYMAGLWWGNNNIYKDFTLEDGSIIGKDEK